MSEEKLTPLEVIVRNTSYLKMEIIRAMMQISSTVKEFDKDLELADKSIRSIEDEEAIAELQAIRIGILKRKSSYLSKVLICQLQLKEASILINKQLMRQVPTEKRVALLIDFDQLVKDCQETQ